MPLNLPAVLVIEKNQIASANPWLVMLEATLPDATKLYLVHNTEDITFNSQVYTAFPFQIEIPKIGSKGELPLWTLRVSNVSRLLMGYFEQQKGLIKSEVIIRFVNAGYLSENYTDLETIMEVLSSKADADWLTFSLGMPSPLRRRFPIYRYIAGHCSWDFKGIECAYSGAVTTCEKTLNYCKTINNSRRFGGKPGMASNMVRYAT